jgi:probable phosphoglycerate mutase
MAIYLIRHGETASNAARIVQTPETPLSPHGIAQAERLARRLATVGITDILSSDLPRAAMTAERLQATTHAAVRFDPRLQERNFGDIRGTPYSSLDVDIFGPDYAPPGGEDWSMFHHRVDVVWPIITDAAARAAGELAVVTHGLVCYSLAARHLRLPEGVPPPWRWANTSLTIIESHSPWMVKLLGCVTHLDVESRDDPGSPSGG